MFIPQKLLFWKILLAVWLRLCLFLLVSRFDHHSEPGLVLGCGQESFNKPLLVVLGSEW